MNRHPNVLQREDAVLLIVDVQEAFRKYIPNFDELNKNITTLIRASRLLSVPVVVSEQYSKGLGHTVAELATELGNHHPYEKNCFSCCGSSDFMAELNRLGKRNVIVCGIEAHVCVNQTVHDLIHAGYNVHLITDAVSSRNDNNKQMAIQKMTMSGALPSTVECALFEMLVNAGTDEFKAVQKLVKQSL